MSHYHKVQLGNSASTVGAESQAKARRVRVGIDVGGTFTDAVVVDHETGELIGQLKVATTHHAPEGVARGIIDAIEQALGRFGVAPMK